MAKYDYKIKIDEIQQTLEEVTKAGYPVYIIINGEYYELTQENDK